MQYFLLILGMLFLTNFTNAQSADSTKVQKEIKENQSLPFAEVMPEYPGGMEELYKFVSRNVVYPKELQAKRVVGKVLVTFVIRTDGKISDAIVVNQSEPLFEKEALRVINAMPNWIPGKQDGKPVNVKFTLPIRFQLD